MKPCKVCKGRVQVNEATGQRTTHQQSIRLCDTCCRKVSRGQIVVEYNKEPTYRSWKGYHAR